MLFSQLQIQLFSFHVLRQKPAPTSSTLSRRVLTQDTVSRTMINDPSPLFRNNNLTIISCPGTNFSGRMYGGGVAGHYRGNLVIQVGALRRSLFNGCKIADIWRSVGTGVDKGLDRSQSRP
jgi:hypothetical protein